MKSTNLELYCTVNFFIIPSFTKYINFTLPYSIWLLHYYYFVMDVLRKHIKPGLFSLLLQLVFDPQQLDVFSLIDSIIEQQVEVLRVEQELLQIIAFNHQFTSEYLILIDDSFSVLFHIIEIISMWNSFSIISAHHFDHSF